MADLNLCCWDGTHDVIVFVAAELLLMLSLLYYFKGYHVKIQFIFYIITKRSLSTESFQSSGCTLFSVLSSILVGKSGESATLSARISAAASSCCLCMLICSSKVCLSLLPSIASIRSCICLMRRSMLDRFSASSASTNARAAVVLRRLGSAPLRCFVDAVVDDGDDGDCDDEATQAGLG